MVDHPVAVALVVGRVGPDRVRRRCTRGPRSRTPCPAAAGSAPSRTRSRRSARSATRTTARAGAEPARARERRSTCSRRRNGGPRGSGAACASFSCSTVVGPVSCGTARSAIGHARSGASTRSASSVVSHIAVVCSSSTGGPSGRGSRVAAITGSTTRSSDGQQLVDPAEQRLEVVELEHPGVVGHRARERIRAQVKAGDDAEEARAGAARRPQQIGVLILVGPDQLAVGGDDVDRGDVLARPAVLAAVPPLPALEQEARRCPTLGQWPPGNARPCDVRNGVELRAALESPGWRWRSRWPGRRSSRASRPRSISRASSRTLQAAQLCPPARTDTADRARARAARRRPRRPRPRPAGPRPGTAPAAGR